MDKPTSDEKIFATLAHVSVLFSFLGPVGPTLIWVSQRDKSKYVRFHALQAMGYQAFAFWGWMVGVFIAVFGSILFAIGMAVMLDIDPSETPAFPLLMQVVMMFALFGMWGLFFLGGIVGAAFCLLGRDFRYPIIGSWLRKKLLSMETTDAEFEEWEDGWVSGVCHATAILQLWGIVTPLIVWFSQKDRSMKLRFQALQAASYQFIAFFVYIIGMVMYFVLIFAMMFGAIMIGGASASPGGELPPVAGVIFMLFFAILTIFWLVMMVGTPVYFLLAAIASIRTIRGHDFKYPILGNIITRRMSPLSQKEPTSS
ncbi:MAG: DUF4870 domain-containing protein [Chloroflexi bacterium]|nr:DUF4870 domain-containing protein [Chloroflexota bacterium]